MFPRNRRKKEEEENVFNEMRKKTLMAARMHTILSERWLQSVFLSFAHVMCATKFPRRIQRFEFPRRNNASGVNILREARHRRVTPSRVVPLTSRAFSLLFEERKSFSVGIKVCRVCFVVSHPNPLATARPSQSLR